MKTEILYEDKHILVAYKPAGLATQTAKIGQQDMVSELKNYLKTPYVGVVHRLDQPVEGILVFGKTKEATAALNKQLGQGTLNKQYYAVICGKPSETSRELVDYLYKTKDNRAEIVSADKASSVDAKKAVLQYQIVQDTPEFCLADIHIETGRFHQIRCQMACHGMPLLGDSKYGTEVSRKLSETLAVRNVALCAYRIELQHPVTKEKIDTRVTPKGKIFQKFQF